MDEYGIYPEIVVTADLGGGWGSWDSFDFGWGLGGTGGDFGGVDFGGVDFGGGGAPADPPPAEDPLPDEVVVTAEPLPYTVEQHPDGTTVARAYDFGTGQSYIHSVNPDGSAFTGTQPFDVTDFSNEPFMIYPESPDWGSLAIA
jgi:hypothetical protein